MKPFEFVNLEDKEYDSFILCLTHESLFSYWDQIESSNGISNQTGRLLIDNLLATGDEANRFIECVYQNGKIDITTAKVTSPNEYYRKLSIKLLRKNYSCIMHSILPSEERKRILSYSCEQIEDSE